MKKIVYILFVFTFFTIQAWPHSGRTDSSGCHNDHKNGGYHCHRSQHHSLKRNTASNKKDQSVYYNKKSHIYHSPDCRWAHACTVNCISMSFQTASQKGRPCKVCGGR